MVRVTVRHGDTKLAGSSLGQAHCYASSDRDGHGPNAGEKIVPCTRANFPPHISMHIQRNQVMSSFMPVDRAMHARRRSRSDAELEQEQEQRP
jgi:hypothetical protein